MKKYVMLCFFSVCIILFQQEIVLAESENSLTIKVHYFRYNGDYDDWSFWLWKDDSNGTEYEFSKEDGEAGVCVQVELDTVSADFRIGTLIKYKNWEKKDVEEDRYLDLSRAQNGVLNVYFVQEEKQIFYSKEEIRTESRITKARIDEMNQISFTVYCPEITTEQFRKTGVSLEEDGSQYPLELSEVTQDGGLIKGIGLLDHLVDLSACSYLLIDGMEKKALEAGDVFSTEAFEEEYCYNGNDLGAVYSREYTAFRVWAPTAGKVEVNLYESGDGDDFIEAHPMEKSEKGTWYLKLSGDYDGVYYTYSVTVQGDTKEAVDPYAKACGVNGLRGMIINLDETDPEGFSEEKKPPLASFSDIILYEMSVRDYTIDESSGVKEKGKYLGLTEEGTVNSGGESTALDYLGNLGVTHVHLLPTQDFDGVDETSPADSYNWGYNPQNYNVPEGSYSTDPYHGEVRVNEYKQMVQSLHKKGIRVVMDVVYNHTYDTVESDFNKIVPGYYYRITEEGNYSNGSACGNEVATERAMARKFIVDSVVYWAEEYHVDGFRFDLMGLIDIETMQLIRDKLNKVDDSIYIYGEGWTGGDTIADEEMAQSENAKKMPGISVFSNVFRRGIQNYVSGIFDEDTARNFVLFGVVAATENEITKESVGSWTENPTQCINYASCHDGFTLWDLIRQNCTDESEDMWKKRNRLSAAIVMTAQGVPFIQSGEELLRSKAAEDDPERIYSNSYNANDYVNSIKWNSISENQDMTAYYKGLMEFRKNHKGLCFETAGEIQELLHFIDGLEDNVIGYTVKEDKNWLFENIIYILYNPNDKSTSVSFPKGNWKVYINGEKAGTEVLSAIKGGTKTDIPEVSAFVAVRTAMKPKAAHGCAGGAVIIFIFAVFVIYRRRKRKQ